MTRNSFALTIAATVIFSCNTRKGKSDSLRDEQVIEEKRQNKDLADNQERKTNLIYLDTAESIYNILCQDWVMEDDAASLEGMTENAQFEIPYRSFYFSANGTFLKNPRNAFDYGTWQYNDETKIITINNTIDRGRDIYKIAKIAYDELILVNVGINSVTNLKFIAPGRRYNNPADEPYALQNNRWRIRPKSPETDEAIHQRLKENIHFFILFYRSALAKDDKAVSFWGLPSCFKWYGGAIYLKRKDELKDNWISCFYNKEQAMKAYAIADKLLSQQYTWPKGERNWLKLNLAVVEMMYKKMDEIK